ncbi:exo-alpha-sialidase [Candidatus Bathyarchaeota archaeon]|nr:exo-alpha-sialidase [Candidatus Bathyarchaeota archaeon]
MSKRTMVFVGTSKGGFIFSSDENRKKWHMSDIQFKSWNVMHMNLDPRDNRLHTAVSHNVYGPTTHYSDDFGKTWIQAKQVPSITRPSASGRPASTVDEAIRSEGGESIEGVPEKMVKVWNITPGRKDEPNVLYAGAQPATLFISRDRGETWEMNEHLYDHPQRGQWNPGNGGLCLHTILLDPTDLNRMYIAVSTAGCYRTDDGGLTWAPHNKNVRADFMPNKFPEFGQCVHKMAMHPTNPNVIYQQNHCGVYRSDNMGDDWIDIGDEKLPSRFGFPIAVHPTDPRTIYVVLEESDAYRMSVDGRFAVWRSRDAGETWQRLTNGLPERAHVDVLREAMATDSFADAGIYIGTNTGQLLYSRDSGDHWELLADFLPPIQSVEAAVIE